MLVQDLVPFLFSNYRGKPDSKLPAAQRRPAGPQLFDESSTDEYLSRANPTQNYISISSLARTRVVVSARTAIASSSRLHSTKLVLERSETLSLFNFLRMEKIDTKVVMYALLPLLLLQFSGLAGAVDIIFYSDSNGCDGGAIGCYGVGSSVCCTASASQGGSVLVNNAGSNVLSKVYRNGGCSTNVGTGPGRSNICYVGGGFTGAFWYNGRRRSLLADPTTCDTQMEPNSVIFTEDSTKGHWILTTSDVDQLYSQMQTVPDAEKANWLKSRGAFYEGL